MMTTSRFSWESRLVGCQMPVKTNNQDLVSPDAYMKYMNVMIRKEGIRMAPE
jgi:hypothetical protein